MESDPLLLNANQMHACIIHKYGKTEARIADMPLPVPASGQVLVRIHAAALNPVDCKTRSGTLKAVSGEPSDSHPVVLGYDCSGIVEVVGPGVDRWKVGDEVFGVATLGALTSHQVVYADTLGRKPAGWSHAETAALVTSGLTALQMLDKAVERIGAPLKKVLVCAGAGGVGHVAIQLAKKVFEADIVVTTASSAKSDFVKELGADEVIDYRKEDFVTVLANRDCDAALDIAEPSEFDRCIEVVKDTGSVVSIAFAYPTAAELRETVDAYHLDPPPGIVFCILSCCTCCKSNRKGNKWAEHLHMLPFSADLDRLSEYATQGKIRPVIDRVFPFAKAVEALDYVELGRCTGKVVVEIVAGAAADVTQRNPL